ncbi:MAG: hypothetical protein ACRDG4_15830 [Chloroflexota bacterium]
MAKHESFLVRVWWRARSGEGQWVGRVEHLQERTVRNFHDPEALLTHLRAVFMPAEAANPLEDKAILGGVHSLRETDTDDPDEVLGTTKAGAKGRAVEILPRDHAELIH